VKLELLRLSDGTGLVICVCAERSRKQIAIPLSQDLSARIDVMLKEDGIGNSLLLPSMEKMTQ
jgi:hypothetical protein